VPRQTRDWIIQVSRFPAMAVLGLLASAAVADRNSIHTSTGTTIFEPIFEVNLSRDATQAARDGKHVMIMFVKDGCSPCEKMKQQVLSDPVVQTYFQSHFLSYQINIFGDLTVIDRQGDQQTEKAYATREGIWATPEFRFFDENGDLIFRRVGAMTRTEFLMLGEFIATRHYRTESPIPRMRRISKQ